MFEVVARAAREAEARKQVCERWRSNFTKIIDNAVVGCCLLDDASFRRALEARAKELGIVYGSRTQWFRNLEKNRAIICSAVYLSRNRRITLRTASVKKNVRKLWR